VTELHAYGIGFAEAARRRIEFSDDDPNAGPGTASRKDGTATMTEHGDSGAASGRDEVEVVYPDGRRGTMTQAEWRERDTSLGIRRADDSDEPDVAEAVDDATPTNEPER
jgi:hypothetical protein